MDIISLIIVIAIIKSIFGKDKEKEKKQDKQKKQSGEQWQQMVFDFVDKAGEYAKQRKDDFSFGSSSASQTYSGANRTYSGASRSSVRSTGNDAYSYSQKQRATKERLQQKYGTTQTQSSYAQTAAKTDILSRAKENVAEEAQDTFKQEAHAEVCAEYRSHAQTAPNLTEHKGHSPECDFETESDIMKRVNDLIVMGYDGEMAFERDFIAEGVDMLNSFTL